MDSLEAKRKEFDDEVNRLVVKLETFGDEIDEHVWEAALREMGYVQDHGPDIDGIAATLLQLFAGPLETTPYQFAYWCRKYGKIEARYKDLEHMFSDIVEAVDLAYKVLWAPQHFAQCEIGKAMRKDLSGRAPLEDSPH